MKKLLLLAVAITLISCQPETKKEIPYCDQTIQAPERTKEIEAAKIALRSYRFEPAYTLHIGLFFNYERSIKKGYSTPEIAYNYYKAPFKTIADYYKNTVNATIVYHPLFTKPGDFLYQSVFSTDFQRCRAKLSGYDQNVYIDYFNGTSSSASIGNGFAIPNFNYTVLYLKPDNTAKGETALTWIHEFGHTFGNLHDDQPVWTINGVPNQRYDTWNRCEAGVKPIIPEILPNPAYAMSHANLCGIPTLLEYRPAQIEKIKVHLESVKDKLIDNNPPKPTLQTFNAFTITSYTSSGTTGTRYAAPADIFTANDTLYFDQPTLPKGVWKMSWQYGTKNGSALDVPKSGKVAIPDGVTSFQFRPTEVSSLKMGKVRIGKWQ